MISGVRGVIRLCVAGGANRLFRQYPVGTGSFLLCVVGAVSLSGIFVSLPAQADAGCASASQVKLCVDLNRGNSEKVTALIAETVVSQQCVTGREPEVDGEELSVAVTQEALKEIQYELGRHRISYALVRFDVGMAEGCKFRLTTIGHAADPRSQVAAAVVPRAKARQANGRMPVMMQEYASEQDALADFANLKKSFFTLAEIQQQDALSIMQGLYYDLALEEVRQFVEEVARGTFGNQIKPSVQKYALRLSSTMD